MNDVWKVAKIIEQLDDKGEDENGVEFGWEFRGMQSISSWNHETHDICT
jgi:hypothetical protein